jgi:DNA-binding response OmpR family regulator
MLKELGCAAVRHATDVDGALRLLRERPPDAAVLDVNLAGESAFAVAERLDAARVPFVFATGYGRDGLPARWAPRLVIQKPFRVETLGAALAAALGR